MIYHIYRISLHIIFIYIHVYTIHSSSFHFCVCCFRCLFDQRGPVFSLVLGLELPNIFTLSLTCLFKDSKPKKVTIFTPRDLKGKKSLHISLSGFLMTRVSLAQFFLNVCTLFSKFV